MTRKAITVPVVYANTDETYRHDPWLALSDPLIDIVVPSHNQSATLLRNVSTLREYFQSKAFGYRFVITIADSALVEYLLEHQGSATWIAAAASANESAAVQLSSSQPVMALGGFSGSDNILSLAQFKELIAAGKVKYYISSSQGNRGGGPGGSSEILSWVSANGKIIDYGGSSNVTLYELSA